jgi:polyhydroxybutyrate depolymerase
MTCWKHAGLLIATLSVALSLTACPMPPAPGTIERSISIDGTERTYFLRVPPGYDGSEAVPLLLALHPFLGNGGTIETGTGFSNIADRENFIVAYPNGVNNSWNDGSGGGSNASDVSFLSALIDTLSAEFVIDTERVFVTGASSGAFMTWRLAAEIGDRLAGIAPVMAVFPMDVAFASIPDTAVPMIYITGTNDPITPFAGGLVQAGPTPVDFLSAVDTAFYRVFVNGLVPEAVTVENLPQAAPGDGTSIVLARWAEGNPDAPVDFYIVLGGGHQWPGGDLGIPQFIGGSNTQELDASETIWAFFESLQ